MTQFNRLTSITLAIILMFSTLVLPAKGAAEEPKQPFLHYTSCPSCNANYFAAVRPVSIRWYAAPTYCEIDPSLANGHTHTYTEEYTLYMCSSCGYERHMNYILTETCPVSHRTYVTYG